MASLVQKKTKIHVSSWKIKDLTSSCCSWLLFLGFFGNRHFLWNANRAVVWVQLQHDGHAVTGSIKKKNWRAHSSVIIFKQAMWKMIMSVLSPSWRSPPTWNTVTLIKIVDEFMQILDGWLEELIKRLYLSDAERYSRPTVFNIWLVLWLKEVISFNITLRRI